MDYSPGVVPCQSCNELLHYSFCPSEPKESVEVLEVLEVECLNATCPDFWSRDDFAGQSIADLAAKLGRLQERKFYVLRSHVKYLQEK